MRRYLCHLGVASTQGGEIIHRLRMAAQLYEGIVAAKVRHGALSPPRVQLLMCLFAREVEGEASLNPTRLSRELGLSKNTISAHLRGLEEAGLVERDVDPQDLRQFQIRLADEGREWLRTSVPKHLAFLDHLVAGLDEQDSAELSVLLDKLIHILHLHTETCCGVGHTPLPSVSGRPERQPASEDENEGE